MIQKEGIKGGHIILLNPVSSEYYKATREQAEHALRAYPGGLQIGGGVTAENAKEFLDAGASHVIVTSYVFRDGKINYDNLKRLKAAVGRDHLVLDLSCRKKEDTYYIVTGIFPHSPSIFTSSFSIPFAFPSTSTAWMRNSSQ